jgi:peptide/nickel transport system ATP-binding protein
LPASRARASGWWERSPSAADPPSGCDFHTRCPRKLGSICEQEEPPLAEMAPRQFLRCHIPIEDLRRL